MSGINRQAAQQIAHSSAAGRCDTILGVLPVAPGSTPELLMSKLREQIGKHQVIVSHRSIASQTLS
jgi:hypothetical protein